MSKSYKSESAPRAPKLLTPQQEYNLGLRRRPKTYKDWSDDDDDDEFSTTDNTIVEEEEEESPA